MNEASKKWILELTEKQKEHYDLPKEYLENNGEKIITELKKFAQYLVVSKDGLCVFIESMVPPVSKSQLSWDYDVPYDEMRKILSMIYSLFPSKKDDYPDGVYYKYAHFTLGEYVIWYKEVHTEGGELLSWTMSVQ